jgi:predicted Zn finger-like uncharacterized protein
MIIACPSCSTRFELSAAALPPAGRKVKCTRCAHVWLQRAQETAALPVVETVTAVHRAEAAANTTVRPEVPAEMIWAGTDIPRRRPASGTWTAVGVAVVAVMLAGFLVFRDGIARAVPATQTIYAALGFEVNVFGIELRRIAYDIAKQDGVTMLTVTGEVANSTSEERPVPMIRVALRGDHANELHVWTFHPGVSTLKAGESYAFHDVLAKPPADFVEMEVRLAEASQ